MRMYACFLFLSLPIRLPSLPLPAVVAQQDYGTVRCLPLVDGVVVATTYAPLDDIVHVFLSAGSPCWYVSPYNKLLPLPCPHKPLHTLRIGTESLPQVRPQHESFRHSWDIGYL